MNIYINPGHCPEIIDGQMVDSGAVNNNLDVTEAEIVRDIGALLEQELSDYNTMVIQQDNLNGEKPYNDFDNSICGKANQWADLIVSLHCNAYDTTKSGVEVLCGSATDLAEIVVDKLADYLMINNRGVKVDYGKAVVRDTTAPAILIEIAFVDNDRDCELLLNHQQGIAKTIADGIKEWTDLTL